MCGRAFGAFPPVAAKVPSRALATPNPPESFNIKNHSLQIGKFLVSPLCKRLATGQYSASVSIRSGKGSGTHDRVVRLLPSFTTEPAAIGFALREGIAWIQRQGVPHVLLNEAACAAPARPGGVLAGAAVKRPLPARSVRPFAASGSARHGLERETLRIA